MPVSANLFPTFGASGNFHGTAALEKPSAVHNIDRRRPTYVSNDKCVTIWTIVEVSRVIYQHHKPIHLLVKNRSLTQSELMARKGGQNLD